MLRLRMRRALPNHRVQKLLRPALATPRSRRNLVAHLRVRRLRLRLRQPHNRMRNMRQPTRQAPPQKAGRLMTWLRLDDGFAEHERILPLTDKAFRLHIVGMLACARNLTDGFVSDARFVGVSATARATKRHAMELEHAGLWTRSGDGWQVRDYLDYNPSANKVREERAKTLERKRRWEEKRTENRNAVRNAVTDTVTNASRNAAPSHPTPSRTTKSVVVSDSSFLPGPSTDGTEGRIIDFETILKDAS